MSDSTAAPRAEPGRSTPPEPFELGDYVPRINLPDPTGRLVSLTHQSIAGGLVVLFCPADGADLARWAQAIEVLSGLGGRLFVATQAKLAPPAPLEGLLDSAGVIRPIFALYDGGKGGIILDSGRRLGGSPSGG